VKADSARNPSAVHLMGKNPSRQAELSGRAEKKTHRVRYEARRVVEKPIVRLLAVLSNETF
jgi:hypothetical protein